MLFKAQQRNGKEVLRECLLDADVEKVLSIVRAPAGQSDPELRELVHKDFFDFSGVEGELAGYDACFFCLGVSSAGMKEADYRRVTYDITMAAARVLARLNPAMTFIYVSGLGTDSSEQGRTMWARVKGKTGERSAAAAVQGGLHVPAGRDRADAWREVENALLSGFVDGLWSRHAVTVPAVSAICDDYGAGRAGNAEGGESGRAESDTRDGGY